MASKITPRWGEAAAVIIILLCSGFAYFNRADYGNKIVTCWDAGGNPLGLNSAVFVCFYWCITAIVILALFMVLSRIGRYRPVSKKAIRCYNLSLVVTELFYAICFMTVLVWNMGVRVNPYFVFTASLGAILLLGAFIVSQTERGWFTEIRVSNNQIVWRRIHALTAIALGIGGLLLLICALLLVGNSS